MSALQDFVLKAFVCWQGYAVNHDDDTVQRDLALSAKNRRGCRTAVAEYAGRLKILRREISNSATDSSAAHGTEERSQDIAKQEPAVAQEVIKPFFGTGLCGPIGSYGLGEDGPRAKLFTGRVGRLPREN